MSDLTSPLRRRSDINPKPLGIAALLLLAGAWYLAQTASPRQAALYIVGALLGIALYHAAFGFTSAWRVFIADGRGAGLRAQMLMLAVGVALFFPALAAGSLFGMPVTGLVSPAGTSVIVGAFIFGIGMQLGGGCASGTLYTVGGGSTRMIVTLLAFIAGSVIATAHMPFWTAMPSLQPISLVKSMGLAPALAFNWILFALIAALTVFVEKRRHGKLVAAHVQPAHTSPWLHGPWPLIAGALALAVLNFATLALSGRPWGVTSAFALWGAKAAAAMGVDVASWPYWMSKANAATLAAPVSHDVTSVMDIGIVLGAMLAAALAGRYAPVWRVPMRSLIAAIVGGLLLGYGARLAYGCNIGAYFSGIVSGSLHGWLWLVAAFFGNVLGTRLRPMFGLEVERLKPTSC
ncbi:MULTISPECIES: YeeE/YedE family protein [unclassified Caballeronia]|uniref:YeeE/YedE family protein n=1 Tax=unclassified Caballeronia TaxID=2646786 RepID=UPI0028606941|nr:MULTISPECIES: YeeE/YedE family protein [unclassified Caballeronia]MDR5740282.1 YeeE/YedE family protein [Caballeronia sp. LZ016]MDR5808538.1 YeeE/YedE family protein [Caballeronia sp. LZ019]